MVDGPSGAWGYWPINIHEIAKEMGVPEATVQVWTQRPSFPHRSGMDETGPIFPLHAVEGWFETEEGRRLLAEAREQVNS